MTMRNITKIKVNTYEIRVSYIDDLTGKRKFKKQRIVGTVKEARALRDNLLHQVAHGELSAPEPEMPQKTLKDWSKDYLYFKKKHLADTSYLSEKNNLKNALIGMDDWLVGGLTFRILDRQVQNWKVTDKRNRTSLRHQLGSLKRFLVWVFRQIGKDPSMLTYLELQVPRGPKTKTGRAMTVEEAKKFLTYTKEHYPQLYALFYLLLTTGQRWGSVTALKKEDICAEWITFKSSHVRGVVREGNKSGKIVRLPMTKELETVLEWHKARMIEVDHPNQSSGLVFPTETPTNKSATNGYRAAVDVRYALVRICEKIKIERITIHDMRRTFNSLQIEAGLDGSILRSITAHSSSSMTDHYYHGSRGAKESAIQTIIDLVAP